jgi:hypothetical protein
VAGFRVILPILAHPENPDSNQDGRDEMQDGQGISAFHPEHPFFVRIVPTPNDLNLDGPYFSDVPDVPRKWFGSAPNPEGVQHTRPGQRPGGVGGLENPS